MSCCLVKNKKLRDTEVPLFSSSPKKSKNYEKHNLF